ncbi:MAG: efflux RND transporter periplasmic adaptor subunit [Bacteroidales bacterium]|nr:efflux RND transporter periplasmic adaptor subunit [Bacteroidales bacterium]
MKINKTLRIVLVITILVIILAVIGKKAGWFGKAETFEVAVEKGEKRTIIETITANGKIQPETEVKITPDVSGEIVDLFVKEGEYVEEGKLLLKIKPDIYVSMRNRVRAALNSAKARLSQVEAQYVQSKLSYDRNKKLWEQETISESDYESAEATYKMAEADLNAAKYSVKSAEASLKEAEENLRKTSIYAPMAGTISTLLIEKGERVVGTEMMSGTELMRVADLSRMEVIVEVNENDIIRVLTGDTAIVEVDAYMDQDFKGLVTEIANSATTTGMATDQVTSFNVKVLLLHESYQSLLDETSNPFRPGMSATVDIQTETKYDIFTIPIQAVTTRLDTIGQEQSDLVVADKDPDIVVFKVIDDYVMSQIVETGIQDNNYIEILSGLSVEDEIVIAPYNAISRKLADSSMIEIVTKKDLFKEK